jgi:hypothetical protein
LLLFTDDGGLAHGLMHPLVHGVEKGTTSSAGQQAKAEEVEVEMGEEEEGEEDVVKTYHVVVSGLAFKRKDIEWLEQLPINHFTLKYDDVFQYHSISGSGFEKRETNVVENDEIDQCRVNSKVSSSSSSSSIDGTKFNPRFIPIDQEKIANLIHPESDKMLKSNISELKKKLSSRNADDDDAILGGSCSLKGLIWHAHFGTATEQLCGLRSSLTYYESKLVCIYICIHLALYTCTSVFTNCAKS